MDRLVLVDNMILSYLADAIDPGYRPSSEDALDQERVAVLRLYFWDQLGVGETAVRQSQRTPDPEHRQRLDRLVAILMPELRVEEWKQELVERRVIELQKLHLDAEDCRIIAEGEALEADAIMTFDRRMRAALPHDATARVRPAAEHWHRDSPDRGAGTVAPVSGDGQQ